MRTLMTIAALVTLTSACETTYDFDDEEEAGFDEAALTGSQQAASPVKSVTTGTCTNLFDFEKELVIRDLSVVDDATRTAGTGVWTFGHLITELAGARDPGAFAREWLTTWETSPTIEGEVVRGNAGKVDDLLIGPWGQSQFAMAAAPFRLSAIVMRPDTPGGAELRFVFGGVTPAPERNAMPMTVAFEYTITPAFMKQWYDTLRPLTLGTPAFNAALATLTELAIHQAGGVNNSSLAQLRTNELAIDTPWDLREFELTATAGGTLTRAKMIGQPKPKFDGDARLATGVTAAMSTYSASIPSKEFYWTVPGAAPADRFKLAMSTCAGCHSKETNTQFLQIKPREAGKTAELSAFLLSRTCLPGDSACTSLENDFTDHVPGAGDHRFTTQDDRMQSLNKVLAAANDCHP